MSAYVLVICTKLGVLADLLISVAVGFFTLLSSLQPSKPTPIVFLALVAVEESDLESALLSLINVGFYLGASPDIQSINSAMA